MKVHITATNKKIFQAQFVDGELMVLSNKRLTDNQIAQLIRQNARQIASLQKLPSSSNKTLQHQSSDVPQCGLNCANSAQYYAEFFCGKKTMVLGECVSVVPTAGAKSTLSGNALLICDKHFATKADRLRAINCYLRRAANVYVAEEISQIGSALSLCPAKIEFKQLGNWLKCSKCADKVICINYRVAQLPKRLRQFLILHAFAHFCIPSHGEEFDKIMRKLAAEFDLCQQQLETFAFLLEI